MEKTMKVIMAKSGKDVRDKDAFYIKDQIIPEPGAKDLLVRILALGMNPVDTKVRKHTDTDKVLGWDAYGVVERIGNAVTGFGIGDKVYYAGDITRPGCNCEFQLVDYRIAAPAPKSLSPEETASMPLTSITAWEGLFDRLGFIPGEKANTGKSILIIGGAGGVGSIAIQMACWAGLKVIATASREETVNWCREMGADIILNHRNDIYDELKKTGTGTVDAIFCTTQMGQHWKAMSECIRPQGRIVIIDDPAVSPDLSLLKRKSITLSWELMYTRSLFDTEDISEQGKLLVKVAQLLDLGTFVTTFQTAFRGLTVENIQAMHIKQESGTMIGKQVLIL